MDNVLYIADGGRLAVGSVWRTLRDPPVEVENEDGVQSADVPSAPQALCGVADQIVVRSLTVARIWEADGHGEQAGAHGRKAGAHTEEADVRNWAPRAHDWEVDTQDGTEDMLGSRAAARG